MKCIGLTGNKNSEQELLYFYAMSVVLVLESPLSHRVLTCKKLPNEEMMNSFKCYPALYLPKKLQMGKKKEWFTMLLSLYFQFISNCVMK